MMIRHVKACDVRHSVKDAVASAVHYVTFGMTDITS